MFDIIGLWHTRRELRGMMLMDDISMAEVNALSATEINEM